MGSTNTPAIKAAAPNERELFEAAYCDMFLNEMGKKYGLLRDAADDYRTPSVRECWLMWQGRAALATPAIQAVDPAPVAPDLARLRVRTGMELQGAFCQASVKFVALADVERLLSHPAQAPVGMAKPESIDCPEFRKLADAYHCADQGRLESAYDALFAYVDNYIHSLCQAPVKPVSALTDNARTVIEEAAQVLESAAKHNTEQGRTVFAHSQHARAGRLRSLLAASPKVEPVSALTDEQIEAIVVPLFQNRKCQKHDYIIARAVEKYLLAASPKVEPVSEEKRDAAQWREMLAAVMAEMPQRFRRKDDRNAPGHGHKIPGVWDSDNGHMAGQECAWCKVWNAAVDRLAATTSPTKEST